jgi:hypothetical protein
MANGRDVKFPRLGVTLACVDPQNCETSHPFKSGPKSGQGFPSLYGSSDAPHRFQYHSTFDCPTPRTVTFENLEDYWAQDFLQTFTDCLKDSDLSTAGGRLMHVSKIQTFEGSSRTTVLEEEDYSQNYSYQCCFYPSYYQVSVRGQNQSTPYFNPLFSSCHDFNCAEEENCMGYGAVDSNYPKATPHSVLWYLLHSLAKVSDEENTVTFWDGHQVGKTHTSATLATQLGYGLGDPEVATLSSLIGSHDMAARLLSEESTGACRLSEQLSWLQNVNMVRLFCPFVSSDNSVQHDYILDYTVNWLYHTESSTPQNSVFPIHFFRQQDWAPLTFDKDPNVEQLDFRLKTKLECCTRPDPTRNNLTIYTFSSNSSNGKLSVTVLNGWCESFLCPTSPICHALLHSFCSYPTSLSTKYCQEWHAWGANSYASSPIFYLPTSTLDPATPPLPLSGVPWGAYSAGVDTSVASLLAACSTSRALNQTLSEQYADMCAPLFTSTYQSNFPRLRVFQFGDTVTYTTESVELFQAQPPDLTVTLDLSYAAYSYTDNQEVCNILMRSAGDAVIPTDKFLCMPIGLSTQLAVLTLSTKTIEAINYANFVSQIRDRFNAELINVNGRLNYPPTAPTPSYIQRYDIDDEYLPFPYLVTVTPAYPNHATDIVFWDPAANALGISHSTIQNSTESRYSLKRQENVNFLYSISTLQIANAQLPFSLDGLLLQNSSFDRFSSRGMPTYTLCGVTSPPFTCTRLPDVGGGGVYTARVPQGVAAPNFTSYLTSNINTVVSGGFPLPIIPLNLEYLPTLTINFSPQVMHLLGITAAPKVVINPIARNGGFLETGTFNFGYTTPFQGVAPNQFHQAVTRAVFNVTNTSIRPFTNLSIINYDIVNYSVTIGTTNLQPQQSTQITVSINKVITQQSVTTTPVLLYDSVSWQASLTSVDYPVLGGFQIVQGHFGVMNTSGAPMTPYTNNRFSTFVEDAELGDNGVSYLSNQNVYGAGATQTPLPVGFRIVPLI